MKKLIVPFIALAVGVLIGYFSYELILNNKISQSMYFDKSLSTTNTDYDIDKIVNLINDYTKNPISFSENIENHEIDPDTAKKLITAYEKQNKKWLFHLKCIKNDGSIDLLRGFYLDGNTLRTILKDGANVGINVYLSQSHEAYVNKKKGRIYSFIFMGAKKLPPSSPSTMPTNVKYHNTLNENNKVYDFVDPCPDACGDFMKNTKN